VAVEDLPGEEWRPVVDYEGWYEVSNLGRVKRVMPGFGTFPGRLCKQTLTVAGYYHMGLCKNGISKILLAHALVAKAFIGPYPEGMEINHKDGDKTNNCVDNIEYVTPSQNVFHAWQTGLKKQYDECGEKNPSNILTEDDVRQIHRLLDEGEFTQQEIADMYGTCRENVSSINCGKTWAWLKEDDGGE